MREYFIHGKRSSGCNDEDHPSQEDFEAFTGANPLRVSPHFSPSLQGAREITDFLC